MSRSPSKVCFAVREFHPSDFGSSGWWALGLWWCFVWGEGAAFCVRGRFDFGEDGCSSWRDRGSVESCFFVCTVSGIGVLPWICPWGDGGVCISLGGKEPTRLAQSVTAELFSWTNAKNISSTFAGLVFGFSRARVRWPWALVDPVNRRGRSVPVWRWWWWDRRYYARWRCEWRRRRGRLRVYRSVCES